jgi:hypothetical protein
MNAFSRWSILLLLLLPASQVRAGEDRIDEASLGFGMGMDYGGFGVNLLYYPNRSIGVFGAGGYALAGFGYNVGLKGRFLAGKRTYGVYPYLQAMYGYHAAVYVTNATQYNKLFYGFTCGAGIDYRHKPGSKGYWSLGLLVPFRSPDVDTYMDDLEQNHGVVFKNRLPAVGFSFGWRLILQ